MTSLAFVWLSTLAFADEKVAEECVQTKVWESYGDGWGVRTLTSATLEPGKTKNYLVTLYAGNAYKVSACGDANVTNLDVLLYDTEGNVLSRDDTTNREPGFTYTPTATATYYVVLYLREVKEKKSGAGVAMAVTYK